MNARISVPARSGDVRLWQIMLQNRHIASFRCYAAARRLSGYSGLWRGVSPANLWVHGLDASAAACTKALDGPRPQTQAKPLRRGFTEQDSVYDFTGAGGP